MVVGPVWSVTQGGSSESSLWKSSSLEASSDLRFETGLLACKEQTAFDFLPPNNSP